MRLVVKPSNAFFSWQVTGLVMRIADLNEELEAAEKREADLAEALTGGTSGQGTIFR